jgi:hypothetical protein
MPVLDRQKINPAFVELEFVIYYMQTFFRPTTMIYTPQNGVESRQATIERDLKEMQFEDGFIPGIPADMQDGRLMIVPTGKIPFDVSKQIITRIAKICQDTCRQHPSEDPGLLAQFIVGARATYMLKEKPNTLLTMPFITERPVTLAFLEILGNSLKESLATFRLPTPFYHSYKIASLQERQKIEWRFTGKVNEHQCEEILNAFRHHIGPHISWDNASTILYKNDGAIVEETVIEVYPEFADQKQMQECLTLFEKQLQTAFPKAG